MSLEIFHVPSTLSKELIEFQSRQDCYPLTELKNLKKDLADCVGVYLLYYKGNFRLYSSIKYANQNYCCLPIYIGKAENKGKRTGRKSAANTSEKPLVKRLEEHKSSICQVKNLDEADFHIKVVAMEVDLVAWAESVLIGHFQPVWCSIISGFGIHSPGKNRQSQTRSQWDEIHPGRGFAKNLSPNPININNLQVEINQQSQNLCTRLGCP